MGSDKLQQPILAQIRHEICQKGLRVAPLPSDVLEKEAEEKAARMRAESLREKMAAVRDSKKKKKRTGGGSQRPTRTPTPDGGVEGATEGVEAESEEERRKRLEEEANGGLLVGPHQVRAHLDRADKKVYDCPVMPVRDEELPDFPFRLRNIVFRPGKVENEKINYLRHLGRESSDISYSKARKI